MLLADLQYLYLIMVFPGHIYLVLKNITKQLKQKAATESEIASKHKSFARGN